MVILGIDPGLRSTGYGIIDALPSQHRVIAAGDIRPSAQEPLAARLAFLHASLTVLIMRHRPDTAVLEKLFTHHAHVTTAALMAHARGVVCVTVQEQGLALAEYPPTQVKQSLTGNGHASKAQVARMVRMRLGCGDPEWSFDTTDALALALVHAHLVRQRARLPAGVA